MLNNQCDVDRAGLRTAQTRPVRVAAFTCGLDIPGARFRVRQYIPALARDGIAVSEYWPGLGAYPPRARWVRPAWLLGTLAQRLPQVALSWNADLSWIYREMVSTLVTLEGMTRRPRLLDVDDSIHLHRDGGSARRLAKLVDGVVVANSFLAETWRQWNSKVEILPMGIDTNYFLTEPFPEKPVIGWLGSPANTPYLEKIAPALEEIVRRFPDAAIAVCSEVRPNLGRLPITFVPWSAAVEKRFLASLTVGLAPIEDSEWGRGKFSYKLLQYMACGRPCVASPVGTNRELLAQAPIGLAASNDAEWIEAISTILSDRDTAQQMGSAARALAVSEYSIEALAPRLAGIIRRYAR
jgi:glycosyltransferase involved in cell wall biosynthesis